MLLSKHLLYLCDNCEQRGSTGSSHPAEWVTTAEEGEEDRPAGGQKD